MIPFEHGPDRTLVIHASDPTPTLVDEIAAREAEKARAKKREQIHQLDRMGKAAKAAKTRNPQRDLFEEDQ